MRRCSMCSYVTKVSRQLVGHVLAQHQQDARFSVTCSIPGCHATYKKWNAFRSHVYRKHRIWAINGEDEQDGGEEHGVVSEEDVEQNVAVNDINLSPLWPKAYSLLKMREMHFLSQPALQTVMETCQSVHQTELNKIMTKMQTTMNEEGICADTVEKVAKSLQNHCAASRLFEELDTEKKLKRFVDNNAAVPQPVEVILETEWVWKKVHGTLKLLEKKNKGYVVPFLESLKTLLKIPDVQQCLTSRSERIPGNYVDIADGSYIKNHPVSNKSANPLLIIVYYDDIQVANALGTKRRSHKLGIFYWLLGNIPAEYRSSIDRIQLLAISDTRFIRKFGPSKLLQSFFADIKELQTSGIDFKFHSSNEITKLYGFLAFVAGDTLGSNYLAGFKEGVGGALRGCRNCMGTRNEFALNHCEENLQLRNKEMHEFHCHSVFDSDLTAGSKTYWSKTYGVMCRSPFMNVADFDCTKCFVHDAMHVVYEGVLNFECRLFLIYCIHEKRFFSLKDLNQKLVSFDFCEKETSKPSPILETDLKEGSPKLTQYASQMRLLGDILPFLVHDWVPSEDSKLTLLIQLLHICKGCFSVKMTSADICVFRNAIQVHNLKFREEYPDASFPPKFHYLVHFPSQIQRFGPLRYHQCFRYEAKHAYLKKVVQSCRNYKNVPKMIATRHQNRQMLYVYSPSGNYTSQYFSVGNVLSISQNLVASDYEYANTIKDFFPADSIISLCSRAVVNGISYESKKTILITSLGCDTVHPQFAALLDIISNDAQPVGFVCQQYNTVNYASNLGSYLIEQTDDFFYVKYCDLKFIFPSFPVKMGRVLHVIIRDYFVV